MHRGKLNHRVSALLLTLLLVATTVSCGSVDEFMDEAGNVLHDVGDVAKDVGEIVKDAVDEHTNERASDSESAGQIVSRPPRPTGTLTLGSETPLVSETVGPAGGSVSVDKPGDPLDGMEIQVQPGSYPDSKQFEVSSAPVDGHTFGEYFTPATPLISIENGGDYSEEFMTVRIPVDIPPDHFAMAFYYDEAAGTLEGIPFISIDEQSITIVTRHFCSLLVSIINNTLLDDLLKGDIDSHFRPGIDDWQFTNYGSYIADGGHCVGQSLSAMWYFCEQPDGVDLTLNGRYDNNGRKPATPDFWMDDSYGYRLASTVQEDVDWASFGMKLMYNLAQMEDEFIFKAFAYSIQLTGEPQEVGLFSSGGGGHDMVCYRVYNNNLYIADPNYPGDTDRRIKYADGAFTSYNSGANADEIAAGHGKSYEIIQFCAKSATVNWNKIGTRWNEFKAGTIGNDLFPQYQLVVLHDGKSTPLTDGYVSEEKRIDISLAFSNVPGILLYPFRDGSGLAWDADGKIELEDGNNLLGFAVRGDANNNPQNRNMKYIDFQYFNIQYGKEECQGWVLDSVEVVHNYGGVDTENEQYVQPLQHDNGHFSYGLRAVAKDYSPGAPGGEVYVTYTTSGSWTPPPDCLAPDQPIPIELNLSSSVDLPSEDLGRSWESLRGILHCNTAYRLDQTLTRDTPSMNETKVFELPPLQEGGGNYQSVAIEVQFLAFAECTYTYHYVWHG